MQANYDAMTQEEEQRILWALIQEQSFDVLRNPDVHAELQEEFSNDVLSAYEQHDHSNSMTSMTAEQRRFSLLSDIVDEQGQSILSVGNVYSNLREQFNNQILKRWEKENPNKAYPISCKEVQSDPSARSISDDDLCAFCALCAYCPGEQSVCRLIAKEDGVEWPAELDDDGYAERCERFLPIKRSEQNWVS